MTKSVFFSFIATLLLTGCVAQKPEPQNPLKSTSQKIELKNEIREQLNLPIPTAVKLKESEQIAVLRPDTPKRDEEKLMRGLMLPYTEGARKWGASFVYDVLKEKQWKYENEVRPPVNSSNLGGIN